MRHATWLACLCLLLVALAAPAWAADAAAEGGGSGAKLLKVDLYAAITAIAVFLILMVVLGKFAWKPILSGMQARETKIQQALDEAQAANEKARELIAQYESRLDQAREEAQAIAEEARKDATDIKAQIEADARRSASETVARAQIEIEQASAKAWERVVIDAASVATAAAGKVIGRELSPEGHAELVSEVVAEFSAKRTAAAAGGSA